MKDAHRSNRTTFSLAPAIAVALSVCLATMSPGVARGDEEAAQTFHIAEINKLMVGFNGDATVQAVEIKMIA